MKQISIFDFMKQTNIFDFMDMKMKHQLKEKQTFSKPIEHSTNQFIAQNTPNIDKKETIYVKLQQTLELYPTEIYSGSLLIFVIVFMM